MTLFGKALLAATALVSAGTATAATVSYRFSTQGQGTAMGLQPDIYSPKYLTNATFVFSFDEDRIRPFNGGYEFVSGISSGMSNATGVTLGANSFIGQQAFSGAFSVCFDNSASTFPTAGFTVASTCRAPVDASGFGSTNGLFTYTGVVTGLTVVAGEFAGEVPVIVNGVPEPSTWALMLAGFGMVGYAMRRRKLAFA